MYVYIYLYFIHQRRIFNMIIFEGKKLSSKYLKREQESNSKIISNYTLLLMITTTLIYNTIFL